MQLSELENYCDELGYYFNDLISQLPGADELTNTTADIQGRRSVLEAISRHSSRELTLSEDSPRKSISPLGCNRKSIVFRQMETKRLTMAGNISNASSILVPLSIREISCTDGLGRRRNNVEERNCRGEVYQVQRNRRETS